MMYCHTIFLINVCLRQWLILVTNLLGPSSARHWLTWWSICRAWSCGHSVQLLQRGLASLFLFLAFMYILILLLEALLYFFFSVLHFLVLTRINWNWLSLILNKITVGNKTFFRQGQWNLLLGFSTKVLQLKSPLPLPLILGSKM